MKSALFLFFLLSINTLFSVAKAETKRNDAFFTMIDIPTAYVLHSEQFRISSTVIIEKIWGENNSIVPFAFSVDYGLFKRFEVTIKIIADSKSYRAAAFDLKLNLLNERKIAPGITIGIENITPIKDISVINDYANDTEYFSPFIVTSKKFGLGKAKAFGHIGWGYNRFLGQGPYTKYLFGFFIGGEIVFPPMGGSLLSIVLEEDGRDINAAMKYSFKERFSVTAYAYRVDNLIHKNKPGFGLEASIYFAVPNKKRPSQQVVNESGKKNENSTTGQVNNIVIGTNSIPSANSSANNSYITVEDLLFLSESYMEKRQFDKAKKICASLLRDESKKRVFSGHFWPT